MCLNNYASILLDQDDFFGKDTLETTILINNNLDG